MSVKYEIAERLRREKAKNLRYKRAISADLNLETITSSLWEMQETASNIRWWYADGDETMLDELIGDEEESYELKMAFSSLEADCYRMIEDLGNEWIPEFFDDFFGCIADRNFGGMLGFDSYEGDYFGLSSYEEKLAQEECEKRLVSHTKKEIVEAYSVCFRVAVNYMALRSRYDGLKSYVDILNGQNTGFLATVKRIEELYEKVADGYASWDEREEFDSLIGNMPDEVWIQ